MWLESNRYQVLTILICTWKRCQSFGKANAQGSSEIKTLHCLHRVQTATAKAVLLFSFGPEDLKQLGFFPPWQAIGRFHRELRTVLLVRLRLADAPQFYDLPSMEVTLECLVHVSANMVARGNRSVSLQPTDRVLLQQLLGTLLEVGMVVCVSARRMILVYLSIDACVAFAQFV